ncbi:hypothetical protein [Nocardioides sp.]|uniref:hypothetical protein n=1 Tax=Nocardioides sp. TaxID=35761 RepID=UPI0031FE4E12|nr:hypothetical protein [Nocardioides sp.]
MPDTRSHATWLSLTALAYAVCHHVGALPDGLGPAWSGTRVADWVDLLAPFLVLSPALLALVAARAERAAYAFFAVGSWLYASGHGIHLAANSIGNAEPGETAHLWDEYVGHYLWYAGVVVVAVGLASTMRGRPRPGWPVAYVLAVAVGATWGTNAVGGQMWVGGLIVAVVAGGVGWRHRGEQPVLFAVAAVPAVLVLVAHSLLG